MREGGDDKLTINLLIVFDIFLNLIAVLPSPGAAQRNPGVLKTRTEKFFDDTSGSGRR